MTKPGIERLLFLAVAFEPTIVDNIKTLCYNRKKDDESYYIYLSNKAMS
jgi:hypothetical protein